MTKNGIIKTNGPVVEVGIAPKVHKMMLTSLQGSSRSENDMKYIAYNKKIIWSIYQLIIKK